MRAIILAFVVSLITTTAQAQSNCGPRKDVLDFLSDERGLEPAVYMMTVAPDTGQPQVIEVLVNPETDDWAQIVTYTSGMSCIVIGGSLGYGGEFPQPQTY